ncbi:MAG TPA: flagellar basal body-associated FliL family protein [Rhodocyclaceae bacterium]
MAEAEQAAPKKKGKLLLFIIIGALVIVLAGGGAAFLLLKKKPAEDEEGADGEPAKHATAKKKDEHAAPPTYIKLETFTTNLATEGTPEGQSGGQYIQVVIELKVADVKEGDALKAYTPEIRNGVLRLLSSKKASQLTTTEGKDALAEEVKNTVNNIVNPPAKPAKGKAAEAPEGPVSAVLFSSFIIQ